MFNVNDLCFTTGLLEKDGFERFAERIGLAHENEIGRMGVVNCREVITIIP